MFQNHFLDVLAERMSFRRDGNYSFASVNAGLLIEADRASNQEHPIKGDHVTDALYHATDADYEALAHHISNRNFQQLGMHVLSLMDSYAISLAENNRYELEGVLYERDVSAEQKARDQRDLEGNYFARGA
ncbi:MAG: hypothetical protein AAGJ50_08305 [Pseudomonadota bacterium]